MKVKMRLWMMWMRVGCNRISSSKKDPGHETEISALASHIESYGTIPSSHIFKKYILSSSYFV